MTVFGTDPKLGFAFTDITSAFTDIGIRMLLSIAPYKSIDFDALSVGSWRGGLAVYQAGKTLLLVTTFGLY